MGDTQTVYSWEAPLPSTQEKQHGFHHFWPPPIPCRQFLWPYPPIQSSKGYFLLLLERLAQPYGLPDTQGGPPGSHPQFFSSPPSSWATRNIGQLATTRAHSLTVRQRELEIPSLLTATAFPSPPCHCLHLCSSSHCHRWSTGLGP